MSRWTGALRLTWWIASGLQTGNGHIRVHQGDPMSMSPVHPSSSSLIHPCSASANAQWIEVASKSSWLGALQDNIAARCSGCWQSVRFPYNCIYVLYMYHIYIYYNIIEYKNKYVYIYVYIYIWWCWCRLHTISKDTMSLTGSRRR